MHITAKLSLEACIVGDGKMPLAFTTAILIWIDQFAWTEDSLRSINKHLA